MKIAIYGFFLAAWAGSYPVAGQGIGGEQESLPPLNGPVFHGIIDDVKRLAAMSSIPRTAMRFTREPNRNHSSQPANDVVSLLWFNQHLKGAPALPGTPATALNKAGGRVGYVVTPQASQTIDSVIVYYTVEDSANPVAATQRKWTPLLPTMKGASWEAVLPSLAGRQKMRVYADVLYRLPSPVQAGWGYSTSRYSISSDMDVFGPDFSTSARPGLGRRSVRFEAKAPEGKTFRVNGKMGHGQAPTPWFLK